MRTVFLPVCTSTPSFSTMPRNIVPAAFVELRAHEPWRELHDMGGEAHVLEGIGRFEPEETAAHDDAGGCARAGSLDGVKVFDGAIDVAMRPVPTVDGRHERIGAGRQNQRVVVEGAALASGDSLGVSVDLPHALANVDRGGFRGCIKREVGGGPAGEVFAEVNPIVGTARLLAEHRNPDAGDVRREFHEAMPHHAVPNHDNAIDDGGALADCVHAARKARPVPHC